MKNLTKHILISFCRLWRKKAVLKKRTNRCKKLIRRLKKVWRMRLLRCNWVLGTSLERTGRKFKICWWNMKSIRSKLKKAIRSANIRFTICNSNLLKIKKNYQVSKKKWASARKFWIMGVNNWHSSSDWSKNCLTLWETKTSSSISFY